LSELIYFAVPAFLALMAIEFVASRHARREIHGYEPRDTAASLSMGIGNVVLSLGAKVLAAGLFAFCYEHRLLSLGETAVAWLLLIPLEDLCYYWFHRLHHEVRFLWAAHENHHSSQHYNLSTALRQSWTTPFTGPLFWTPLAFAGFTPAMIFTAQAISLLYQFWIHTELVGRMGPFEWLFNTPSHHRVHHGRNLEYLDRNHGGILIIWDRLFGTFEPEEAPVDFGLTKNIHTFNPVRIAFHEFASLGRDMAGARTFGEALRYAIQPPGWSPDGRSLTAHQLRAARASAAPTATSTPR
jgi:sterol desaturase/sphingolipid hydroxylase (fatty acid hydroxylase superfamily)